jgi:hypothetical protein
MATMDLRLVVGGLLTRNAVLGTLLMNYADRLEQGCSGQYAATGPCFIVPTWTVVPRASTPSRSHLLRVEAHAAGTDPGRHQELDAILRLLHLVLTDDHASTSITARRLGTSACVVAGGHDSVVQVGTWDIVPTPSGGLGTARQRLLPWPSCSASVITTGAPAPGINRVN